MYTNKQGISFYKKGNRYYKNTGWREVEISKEEYNDSCQEPGYIHASLDSRGMSIRPEKVLIPVGKE
jgi:hypothetical protein